MGGDWRGTETVGWRERDGERFRGMWDTVGECGQSAARQLYYRTYITQVFLDSSEWTHNTSPIHLHSCVTALHEASCCVR